METKTCGCGGTMYHSSTMNPFAGDDDHTPYWQCEECGAHIDETAVRRADGYYRAVHRALSEDWDRGVSVWYDAETDEYKPGASGFRGWSLIEVLPNVTLDQFTPDGDLPPVEEFVAACVDAFGLAVPTGIETSR